MQPKWIRLAAPILLSLSASHRAGRFGGFEAVAQAQAHMVQNGLLHRWDLLWRKIGAFENGIHDLRRIPGMSVLAPGIIELLPAT